MLIFPKVFHKFWIMIGKGSSEWRGMKGGGRPPGGEVKYDENYLKCRVYCCSLTPVGEGPANFE